MRTALVHVQMVSAPAMEAAFSEGWPDAEIVNVLDEALFTARARGDAYVRERFLAVARYVADTPVDGILFTCSAFGAAIEAVQRLLAPLPVLKPNEAMIEAAAASRGRVGLLATFAPTLEAMPREFPPGAIARCAFAPGAFDALNAGNAALHDQLVAEAAVRELAACDVIALAQSSMARAAGAVALATGKAVLTTPATAVAKLRGLVATRPA